MHNKYKVNTWSAVCRHLSGRQVQSSTCVKLANMSATLYAWTQRFERASCCDHACLLEYGFLCVLECTRVHSWLQNERNYVFSTGNTHKCVIRKFRQCVSV